jgi:hypothetical protein
MVKPAFSNGIRNDDVIPAAIPGKQGSGACNPSETIAAVKALMRDFTPKGVKIAKAPRQRVTASSSKPIN